MYKLYDSKGGYIGTFPSWKSADNYSNEQFRNGKCCEIPYIIEDFMYLTYTNGFFMQSWQKTPSPFRAAAGLLAFTGKTNWRRSGSAPDNKRRD